MRDEPTVAWPVGPKVYKLRVGLRGVSSTLSESATSASSGVKRRRSIRSSTPEAVAGKPTGIRSRCRRATATTLAADLVALARWLAEGGAG